ncbi:MAG: ABC transporter ATP-binding protein [Caldilineaceae bacterium]|nr:ABC transporter ATP-binding protein [Caldilineaceae bacterium]
MTEAERSRREVGSSPPGQASKQQAGPRGGPSGAPSGSFKHLGRAIRYLGRYRRTALIAYVSLFLSTAAQLVVPQLVQNILDAVSGAVTQIQAGVEPLLARQMAETALLWAIALTLVFAVIRGLFSFAQSYMAEKVSQELAFDFRNELFAKIQHLSFSYHDRNQTGQLMIRATDDVEKLRVFIGQGLLLAVQALVLLVGALVLLGVTNWNLTLHILPILPIALVLFMFFGAVSQPLFGKVQAKLSALNTVLQENLAGIKVVKSFAREPLEQERFAVAADDLLQQQIALARVFSFLFPLIFLIANIGQVVIIYFGGNQVVANTLTVGEWQKFGLYLVLVFFPIGQLGFIISQMSQASASAARIFEILDTQNEVADRPNAQPLPPVQGQVVFQAVSFRYFNSSEPVLSQVTLAAKPGETVALLGATGSGKTTIINLIPRFYDVSEGQVLIDGYDVRDVQLDSLRRQIGIVLQETNLFTGTIRDNIAFGRPGATDEEVMAAAKAAAAHDFILSFPQGYATAVGERGATLSGGQKQRVAIARALLLDPRILILDDSTSSVDVATEVHIQRALDRLMEGRTSFVIAQRISTVLNADQILVLDKGQVVARGKHADLLESNALYAEIYRSQLVEDAAPSTTRAEDMVAELATPVDGSQ